MTGRQANAIMLRTPPVNLVTSRSRVVMACVIAKSGPGRIVRRAHRYSVITVAVQVHMIPTVHTVPT